MPLLEQVLEKYPKEVRLVVKHFPLSMHPFARKAALAAAVAQEQGKFWEFHDKLFEKAAALNDQSIRQTAQETGLDIKIFDAKLADPKIASMVERDLKIGAEAGVRGTPTVIINGRLLQNRSPEGFQQMIDAQLKKAAGQ